MNEKVFKTLEYNKIIELLADKATCPSGKDMCHELLPYKTIEEVNDSQEQTSDALRRIFKNGSLSLAGTMDVRSSLMRLSVGATLGIGELLGISRLLKTAAAAKNYDRKSDDDYTDSLTGIFEQIEPLTNLNNDITRCIVSEDTISDDASPSLKSIRRETKILNGRIREQLQSIINSQNNRDALQDSIITMRNNRYCVPVKSEYRSRIPGMIHDQSSTGSTLFIEPNSVVKLNNDLSALAAKEQTEIEKILSLLSNACAIDKDTIEYDFKLLTQLDFIFAKGNLAKEMDASRPDYNEEHIIYLKSARHPLIDKHRVVPVDINIGDDFTMLVITGPNTGGKTVTLKTAGLLSLMGQAGLHIPALDGSKLSMFDEIYADIGDEQSIEQSLSTFSSHMVNTVKILDKADENSLVLFDELGAGTDPTEGAALATSILAFLHGLGVRTIATTHYSEIKLFALETPGIENACCEFDVSTLAPTYRLLIGVPGKSNAFSISSKLGLPGFIIDDAKSRIDITDRRFEDVIADLAKSREAIEKEREVLALEKTKAEQTSMELNERLKKLDTSRSKILDDANEKAKKILDDAKEYADNTLRKFHKLENSPDIQDAICQMENERNALHDKMKKSQKKRTVTAKPKKQHKPNEFHLGDTVRVLSMNTMGTVHTLPDSKGNMFVQMGILRSRVNISDVELVDEVVITGPGITKTGGGKIKMSKSLGISTEVKLIGMTVDEALSTLDKYLDDAYLAHLQEVTIIHGRGTGALKNAVAAKLRQTKYVDSFHIDEHNYGATIAKLK